MSVADPVTVGLLVLVFAFVAWNYFQIRSMDERMSKLEKEYLALIQELEERIYNGEERVLGPYATTNQAELFAVATENFFERPRALEEQYPELYQLLRGFYQLDPTQWSASPREVRP